VKSYFTFKINDGLFLRPACLMVGLLFLILATGARANPPTIRERLSFNDRWRFIKGDPDGTVDTLSYAKIKEWILPSGNDFLNEGARKFARPAGNLGGDTAYTQPGFDDSSWRVLDLPHDWGIEGPFKQEYPGMTGKLPWWGVAWYRKHFKVPAEDAGKRVFLDVDGAMSYATVWLNGQFVGGWPYGYASWRLDLTPYLRAGAENVIAIRLENPRESARWYPGGGIYRNVWLVKTAPVHMAQWGVFVTTPQVSAESAQVYVEATLQNDTTADANVQVSSQLFELDADVKRIGEAISSASSMAVTRHIVPRRQASVSQMLTVSYPKLWSLHSPQRYVAVTTVTQDGKVVDVYETPFGLRRIAFTSDRGFLLNGQRVPIQGVCLHHDLGALGAALNVRALQRQLEILKEMGANAIRTSHNPPAPELLELCDRMGLLVLDEAFDTWREEKTPQDYHLLFPDWHEQDLRAMVRRDRNHPSVILWSIGNEVRAQRLPEGWKMATHLAAIVHEEDRTRPVTTGCNKAECGYNGFQIAVDVTGFNYLSAEYGKFNQSAPQLPLLGTETSSCVSSRGEYFFPATDNKLEGRVDVQVSSYDLYGPSWSLSPDGEWKGLAQAPFVAGEFVWTGFDYLGEPTPYEKDSTEILKFTDPSQQERANKEFAERKTNAVPSRSSYFGIVDLAGFKKDRFFLYQSHWRPNLPMAHILPHWNWPERIGLLTPVHVYTSGDEAELFLNGKSLGRKKRSPFEYRLRWDEVRYTPGELRVVAYKSGAKWAEDVVRTTGAAAKVMLTADRVMLRADGRDLSFITASIVDKNGLVVPRAKNRVSFEVSGPAEIVATDNGDATNLESFQAKERAAYNGLVLVIVRTKAGASGPITLRAKSKGLAGAEVMISSTP
jgi:beta-galactosidase